MVSNLIFSYSGRFFILLVPAFDFDDLGGVAGALPGEDWGKKVIEYLSLLRIPGNQVSCFLPERAHIFPSLPFITNVPIESFLVALDKPKLVSNLVLPHCFSHNPKYSNMWAAVKKINSFPTRSSMYAFNDWQQIYITWISLASSWTHILVHYLAQQDQDHALGICIAYIL